MQLTSGLFTLLCLHLIDISIANVRQDVLHRLCIVAINLAVINHLTEHFVLQIIFILSNKIQSPEPAGMVHTWLHRLV